MDDDDSLIAVVAHGLLNDLTFISGILSEARALLDSESQHVGELLDACESKTSEVIENLRRYAAIGEAEEHPPTVIDLNEKRFERPTP